MLEGLNYYVDQTTLSGWVKVPKLHLEKLIKNGDTF